MSGAKVHHAGYKEEPTGQRALPLSGACRGRFGGHRSVPHEEAGEDDQKRISPQVSLPYFYFYVMTNFKGPIYDDHASFSVKCLSCLASIIHFLPLTQFRVIEVWSLSQRSWSDSQDIPWTCYQYIAGLAERVRQQFTLTCTSMVKSTSQIKLM